MSDTDTLVRVAEQRCQANGTRFTPIRRRVFELISESPGGLKAYELLDQLSSEHASARPPTVYRALEFLSEQGLVHRVESRNAYIACPCPEHSRGFQLMICRNCGRVEELHEQEVVDLLERIASRYAFRIERQTIELSGLCHECRD
ncbi:Fur family zinc uptake transcriptional regulator [Kushneria sinocarnis]|uniref:Ferric uptake regulation protein n=1 Tax=Kushneria sinocarnis TaxID=595502 RepID=A0A420WY93_9GAMM|nr:Fur family transcriptional regulator [Kushneria sinocarnis]RKR06197.1 Fur family zinc uptake transcriptional regulator [Kushneria sinocarnis]